MWMPIKEAAKHLGITTHGVTQRRLAGTIKTKGKGRARLFYVNGATSVEPVGTTVRRKDNRTLLEKAKAASGARRHFATNHNPEELELALAYVNAEISGKQLAAARGVTVSRAAVSTWVGGVLMRAYKAGALVEKK